MVTGAQTEECIRGTLHGALVRGYDATLVGDAHTTEDLREWGVPGLPGAVDRVHQHVLELGVSTRSAGHGRTDHGGGLRGDLRTGRG